MNWVARTISIAVTGLTFSSIGHAQVLYTNPVCEFIVAFPQASITHEDEFTARTEFEAIPYLIAKCFRCPQACRLRNAFEKELLSGLIAQFELKDYVLTNETTPHKGFRISGITTKENSITRIEARVLFGDNSILVLSTVQPVSADNTVATTFLQSGQRRANAP